MTLTDAEAIEAQVVENLQREDIHPLEESLGFKSLLQLGEPTYTIASIAARAGKSEAYGQGRIKLADLIPPLAEAFLQDKITIGHALLIAKLPDSPTDHLGDRYCPNRPARYLFSVADTRPDVAWESHMNRKIAVLLIALSGEIATGCRSRVPVGRGSLGLCCGRM